MAKAKKVQSLSKKIKRGRGRPSKFNQKVADKICQGLSEGHSLKALCRMHDDLPTFQTVHNWLLVHKNFFDCYIHARKIQAHFCADEMRDRSQLMWQLAMKGEADLTLVQAFRVYMDSIKWTTAHLFPQRYNLKDQKPEPTRLEPLVVKFEDVETNNEDS